MARWIGIAGLALVSCGRMADSVGGDGGGTSEASVSATSAGDGPTTTGAATTGESTTGLAPASVCDPQPEAVETEVVIDGLASLDQPEGEQVHDCVVAMIEGGLAAPLSIEFDCVDGDGSAVVHSLEIDADPMIAVPLQRGDEVRFDLWTRVPWWGNEYLAIRDPNGALLLGFVDANAIPTPRTETWDEVPPASFFAPLELALASVCEPDCEPMDGPIAEPCPCELRLAIDFAVGDEVERVLDRGTGTLAAASLELRVDRATQWGGVAGQDFCATDDPGEWYRVLVTRDPS